VRGFGRDDVSSLWVREKSKVKSRFLRNDKQQNRQLQRFIYCGVTVRFRVTVWVMTSPVVELAVT